MIYDPIHDTYTAKESAAAIATHEAEKLAAESLSSLSTDVPSVSTEDSSLGAASAAAHTVSSLASATSPPLLSSVPPTIAPSNPAISSTIAPTTSAIAPPASAISPISSILPSAAPVLPVSQSTSPIGQPSTAVPHTSTFSPLTSTISPSASTASHLASAPVVSTTALPISTTEITNNELNTSQTSPQRKALSISSLVSPPSTASISNLINDELDFSEGEDPQKANFKKPTNGHSNGKANGFAATAESNGIVKPEKPQRRRRKYTNTTIPKCRNLKKADGEPFWRSEIQYDFLQELFNDQTLAFTNSFEFCDIPTVNNGPKLTFAESYIRTLAESSKCSKILRERLIRDSDMGKSVSKVCLLVNAGRMNTTINFVPEMRSTLRTYHSIPSLQADPKVEGTRPLQDTPRLKSILKAVCEGSTNQPVPTLNDILTNPPQVKPNTNLVQIIFYLSNLNQGIPHYDTVDPSTNTFMDFFLNSKIHPKNRAKRLLWLLYTYLETSFTPDELAANPFGATSAPPLVYIDDDKLSLFDKDTKFEIEYSEQMHQTRLKYLADEEHNNSPKRGNKSKKEHVNLEGETNSEDDSHDDSFDDEGEHNASTAENSAPLGSDEEQSEDSQGKHSKDSKKRPAALVDGKDPKQKKRRLKKNTPKNHLVVTPSPLSQNVITANDKRKANQPQSIATEFIDESQSGNDFLKHQSIIVSSSLDRIHFPLENFDQLLQLGSQSSLVFDEPAEETSIASRLTVVEMSKPIIREVRTSSKASTASFNKKTIILGSWLYRYFTYKKSIGNKLLGIEWEDIRYDLANGIESYIYTQWGKVLSSAQEAIPEGEAKNSVGLQFWPVRDFDSVNEKLSFTLQLMSYCNDWFIKKLRDNNQGSLQRSSISFDLDNDVVNFA